MDWDQYFMSICNAVASKSPCLSRKIGCVLVRDKIILSTGYNGPPRNFPHCDSQERLDQIEKMIQNDPEYENFTAYRRGVDYHLLKYGTDKPYCPRRILHYETGQGLHLCVAAHAEENCISTAARSGVSVYGSTLYINTGIPCSRCLTHLVNAGIKEIVSLEPTLFYDQNSRLIIQASWMKIRGPIC